MAEAADSPGAADAAGATSAADAAGATNAVDAAGASGDPKAAFKAALDRKRGQQAARNEAGGPTGGGKIHGEHSAAGGKRTFRRKSGG